MTFGDPWTAAQRKLVDIVIDAWCQTGGAWPTFQYVAQAADDAGYDAVQVLYSFPTIGERKLIVPFYSEVIFEHLSPQPREDSEVALSVAGLSRHPVGRPMAEAFAAVLSLAANRWKQAPHHPTKVVEITLTDTEVAQAFPSWPPHLVFTRISIIAKEPVLGRRSWSPNPHGGWQITFDRGITRYRGVTVEHYIELIMDDFVSASTPLVHAPPPTIGPALTPTRSWQATERTPTVIVHSMDPKHAIRELRKLRDAASTPEVQRSGPAHDEWKAKVRIVMKRALGEDASVLRDFEGIRYHIGIYAGAPGEAERDRQYFTQQVGSAVAYIDAAMYELDLSGHPEETIRESQPERSSPTPPSIFLVHGHDEGAKHAIARFIELVTGGPPVILDEQASEGGTLVEKFEKHAGSSSFAVVLLTPDDVGRVAAAASEEDRPRARQNVVFELGYFFAKLGRGNVAVVNAGVERPSDVDGLLYISYPHSNWQIQLAKELQAAGIRINTQRLLG